MMKFCCLIVIILYTIHVSTGGRLTGNCLASNGTCGQKGRTCESAFGKGWIKDGRCCNGGPCCKLPCVPTANCPEGYVLLDNQTASRNCYAHSKPDHLEEPWTIALSICTMTPGAYLWRPNSLAEASAAFTQFRCANEIWTGGYSPGQDGNFVFAVDNGVFNYSNVPFGITGTFTNESCIALGPILNWEDYRCTSRLQYICEFPMKTCP
ncbi:uncharacterized protein LOC134684152 [Mytilus trossulus]|uniref:uncharacterized protein LOC134684152 n=1 Tax=Mytilus trossulus TaxID=6551 RepID=UPI0030052FAE